MVKFQNSNKLVLYLLHKYMLIYPQIPLIGVSVHLLICKRQVNDYLSIELTFFQVSSNHELQLSFF